MSHSFHKPLTEKQVSALFSQLKPILDPDLLWLGIETKNGVERPVGFMILVPEVNTWFRFLNGKFGLWSKLKFLFFKWRTPAKRATGVVFGVDPDYQGTGLAFGLVTSVIERLSQEKKYENVELNWIGSFNSKMISFLSRLEAVLVRKHATYVKELSENLTLPQPLTRVTHSVTSVTSSSAAL